MEIYELVRVARYIIIAIGIIGLIVLFYGRRSRNKDLVRGGAMVIIISIVLYICGNIILKATPSRLENYIFEQYSY